MADGRLGPLRKGWRFYPTDEELTDNLREKNAGNLPEIEEVPEVDICEFRPEELPVVKPFDDPYLPQFTISIQFGGRSFHVVWFEFGNVHLSYCQLQIFI